MSQIAIEARLDALGGLHALGLSLADVDGPPLPRSVFDNRSVFVQSRASAAARAAVGLAAAGDCDIAVFASYAGKTHLVGDEFELVLDAVATRVLVATRCILVGVTQQFSVPLDQIPVGWKTVAVFRFVDGIPDAIANLPERDGWDAPAACRLVKAADWRRKPG